MTNTSVLQGLANNCRLQYVNEPEPAAFGVFDNFGIVVKYLASERQYIILVSAAATSDEAVNGMISSLSQFAGERKKTINYTSYLDKVVTISVRDVGKNTISALQEAVGAATYFCNQFGFVPVCKYCGNQMDLGFFAIGGTVDTMCTQCFNKKQAETSNMAMTEANKQFNLPMGILGAVLGALIGGVVWIITSLVISLVMVFAAEYLAVGISLFTQGGSELMLSFGDSFKLLNMLLFDNSLNDIGYGMSSAIKELKSGMAEDMIYGLISYVVAAVLFIVDYAKEKKVKYQAIRLG